MTPVSSVEQLDTNTHRSDKDVPLQALNTKTNSRHRNKCSLDGTEQCTLTMEDSQDASESASSAPRNNPIQDPAEWKHWEVEDSPIKMVRRRPSASQAKSVLSDSEDESITAPGPIEKTGE